MGKIKRKGAVRRKRNRRKSKTMIKEEKVSKLK